MELAAFTAMFGIAVLSLAIHLSRRLRLGMMLGDSERDPAVSQPLPIRIATSLSERFCGIELPGIAKRIEASIGRRLIAAGFEDGGLARGYLALMVLGSFVGVAFVLVVSKCEAPGPAFGAATFACFLPLMWLARRAIARRDAIERGMPFALDMLSLCVEAGCDLAQAIVRVSERLGSGALSDEFAGVSLALRTGASRKAAFARLARPGNPKGLAGIAKLLIQADRAGSGVAKILRGASARLADERFARAERMGAYAAQKLLAPLILCIMPSTFVVIFGPIVVRLLEGGVGGLLG
jgi:pilus assembly protein TadC